MNQLVYAGLASFAIALISGPWTIGFLRKLRAGQPIRGAGPKTHAAKAGTPTMGGVLILLGAALATLAFATPRSATVGVLLTAMLGFGLIGLLDDFVKVTKKRSLGLKARAKLLIQLIIAGFVAVYAYQTVGTEIIVPFMDHAWTLPTPLFFALAIFAILGTVNGVNLTDGLDGLVAGTAGITSAVFCVIAWRLGEADIAIFAAAIAGACFGFSWFNAHPAAVFMGDTGALALGGALGAIAVLTGTELVLAIVGGIFVVETLSVIIQVTYFRLTKGKRIFRMTPLHHHYELAGLAETKIVTRFWLVSLILGIIGLISIRL